MRKTFKVAAIALAATAMLVGCGKDPNTVKVVGPYLTGEKAKTNYNALLTYNLSTLNNAITGHSEDGQHIANFVDGLLENDEFGRLSKALAETIEVNTGYTKFTFTIKDNIPWLKSDGTQYSANVDGTMVPQFVKAEDFITTFKHCMDYSDPDLFSDTYYLPAMFLQGGWEYWFATYMTYYIPAKYKLEATPERIAAMLVGNGYSEDATAADVPDILAFKRVGAKVLTDGRLELTLADSMPYFASVLTYSCFLPMNAEFVEEVGYANFGSNKDNFLYNGAYRLSSWNEGEIEYTKNDQYWDADNVHVKDVHYTLIAGDIGYDYTRTKYENEEIDGFTVSQNDEVGWGKYILGEDESGSLESPASDDAYSRFVEGVDSSFFMMFNMQRDEESTPEEQSSELTADEIINTNRAIKLDAVREILFKGVDLNVYNERYGTSKVYQEMYQIHTYTPRNFCLDSANDKDYIDYVYEKYAERYGGTAAQAEEKLRPGQIAGSFVSAEDLAPLRTKVSAAITAYNAANLTDYADDIATPIKVEYLGLSFDDDNLAKDTKWIENANERINGCTINQSHVSGTLPLCADGKFPTIEIVNNLNTQNSEFYSDMGSAGYYNMYIMGWGPDYADPLTYLNTLVTNGDMSGYTNTAEDVTVFSVAGGVVTSHSLLGDFDALVAEGSAINDDIAQRYATFAEAEVELLFDTNLIRPLYNLGQGWRVTVTKTIAYEKPTATYGLSENKLKGMWVMVDTVGATKRLEMKAYYETLKANLDPNYSIYA